MPRYEFKEIGEKIKELRKKNKMTQSDLAEKLSTTKSTICNWETGYSLPKPDALRDLSSTFGVSTDYILSFDYKIDDVPDLNCMINESESDSCYNEDSDSSTILKFTITDTSVNKILKSGDVAIVSKQTSLKNGDLGLFFINSERIVRRYSLSGDLVVLSPESFDLSFMPMIIKPSDFDIIGKVTHGYIKI